MIPTRFLLLVEPWEDDKDRSGDDDLKEALSLFLLGGTQNHTPSSRRLRIAANPKLAQKDQNTDNKSRCFITKLVHKTSHSNVNARSEEVEGLLVPLVRPAKSQKQKGRAHRCDQKVVVQKDAIMLFIDASRPSCSACLRECWLWL